MASSVDQLGAIGEQKCVSVTGDREGDNVLNKSLKYPNYY